MIPKIIINGATGKMGSITTTTLKQRADFEVIAELSHHDDLALTLKQLKPDIVIDFTTANVAYANARIIINANIRPVIGTSGLLEEQILELQNHCQEQRLGGIIAPNFSIGAILMMKYAQDAAKYFQFAEIIEMHHEQKIDAPSGTAIRTS